MSDLFAPPMNPDLLNSPRLQILQMDGDNMEPTLRSRFDYMLVAPVDRYEHDGIYVLDADPLPGMGVSLPEHRNRQSPFDQRHS